MRRLFFCGLAFFLLTTLTCYSQQSDVRQFNIVGGYSYISTPSLNLVGRGFNGDIARNVRPWLSMGFDFSTTSGDNTVIPKYLNVATQTKLAAILQPMHIPLSFVAVPTQITTQTYEAGPQFNYRHFRKVTLFARPALGLLHAKIQTHPAMGTAALVGALLGGKLSTADTSVFYGVGGGVSWEIDPHFGLRFTTDVVRYNFFAETLNGARTSVRFSVTPKVGFGRNIMSKY